MIISFARLEDEGFSVSIKDAFLEIYPQRVNEGMVNELRELCGGLGFNELETESAIHSIVKIQTLAAIRKAID